MIHVVPNVYFVYTNALCSLESVKPASGLQTESWSANITFVTKIASDDNDF